MADNLIERRSIVKPGRRASDRLFFDDCPRYEKHELTNTQMIEIAKMAVDLAKRDSEQAIGNFIIHEGGSFLAKLMFLFGSAAVAIYVWAHSKGINL